MKKIRFKEKRPLVMIAPQKIAVNPDQPRKEFEESSLSSLAQSLRENGMMQPLTVRKSKQGYHLIAGERRLRGALLIGMKKVPCIVVQVDPHQEAVITLLENLQRQPLHFLEEAQGISQLLNTWQLTPEDAAARLGISCNTLSAKLQLLTFTPWQQERIRMARLDEHQARCLLQLAEEEERNECILQVIAHSLTPWQTQALVEKRIKEKEAPPPTRKTLIGDLRLLQNTIDHAITTMNRSGLLATANKTETQQFVEYTLHIEKKTQEPKDSCEIVV